VGVKVTDLDKALAALVTAIRVRVHLVMLPEESRVSEFSKTRLTCRLAVSLDGRHALTHWGVPRQLLPLYEHLHTKNESAITPLDKTW
jgi:hypothetical protein